VLALLNANTIGLSTRFHYPVDAICRGADFTVRYGAMRQGWQPQRRGPVFGQDQLATGTHPKPVRKAKRRRYSAPPPIWPSTIRGCAREACVRATCDPEACVREVYDPEACDPYLRCDRDGLRTA
jgi:hypothetical protein